MFEPTDDELLTRARRAYFLAGKKEGGSVDIPSEHASGREEIGDHSYVVLRNGLGILAVYRLRNDGLLKRLKRWPKEL